MDQPTPLPRHHHPDHVLELELERAELVELHRQAAEWLAFLAHHLGAVDPDGAPLRETFETLRVLVELLAPAGAVLGLVRLAAVGGLPSDELLEAFGQAAGWPGFRVPDGAGPAALELELRRQLAELEAGGWGPPDPTDEPSELELARDMAQANACLELAARTLEPDVEPRPTGCRCQWEAGDSPCPVHGDADA